MHPPRLHRPGGAGADQLPTAETDYVFDVKQGRYYGHPNPVRCEWVLAGGNPTAGTDPFEVRRLSRRHPPDPNFDLAGIVRRRPARLGQRRDRIPRCAFGGALDGKLLVVRYSAGQDIETFDVGHRTGALSNRTTGITGLTGFSQPLDVTEDAATGNLYVTELGAEPHHLAATTRVAAGTAVVRGDGSGRPVSCETGRPNQPAAGVRRGGNCPLIHVRPWRLAAAGG